MLLDLYCTWYVTKNHLNQLFNSILSNFHYNRFKLTFILYKLFCVFIMSDGNFWLNIWPGIL